jgi:hypothetical protein
MDCDATKKARGIDSSQAMIGTFVTSEGESLKNLKQRMKLRGEKVTTGGRCYSRALCAIGGKDVV